MSAPMGHDRSPRKATVADDEEEDLVVKLLDKSGCGDQHYAVQECMFDKKDWRQCQGKLKEFKECMERNKQKQNQNSK